ncbi:hypothetical protein [Phaffia rhodozyma]|uniref:Uncharacterized protein n=1 Tax=Phaffia rhodozyma TaxID=264483 RepID=A0A0F7SE73_PHARH|nr:hypothetical protein [Phaffia rhodozyma]
MSVLTGIPRNCPTRGRDEEGSLAAKRIAAERTTRSTREDGDGVKPSSRGRKPRALSLGEPSYILLCGSRTRLGFHKQRSEM